jgi:hypothetical protein
MPPQSLNEWHAERANAVQTIMTATCGLATIGIELILHCHHAVACDYVVVVLFFFLWQAAGNTSPPSETASEMAEVWDQKLGSHAAASRRSVGMVGGDQVLDSSVLE